MGPTPKKPESRPLCSPPAAMMRRTPDHPPYDEMVRVALRALADKRGSTEASISDFIVAAYPDLPWGHANLLPYYLRKLVAAGNVTVVSAGRYSLPSRRGRPPKIRGEVLVARGRAGLRVSNGARKVFHGRSVRKRVVVRFKWRGDIAENEREELKIKVKEEQELQEREDLEGMTMAVASKDQDGSSIKVKEEQCLEEGEVLEGMAMVVASKDKDGGFVKFRGQQSLEVKGTLEAMAMVVASEETDVVSFEE